MKGKEHRCRVSPPVTLPYCSMKIIAAALLAFLSMGTAHASAGPQPLPPVPPIQAPQDIAFQGSIKLAVDATDRVHKILRVKESIPVQLAGPIDRKSVV